MPNYKKGETRNDYMKKCVHIVMKENPSLSNNAAVGKCEGMYDSHWSAKKKTRKSATGEIEEYIEDCDCQELNNKLDEKLGIFNLDIINKKY